MCSPDVPADNDAHRSSQVLEATLDRNKMEGQASHCRQRVGLNPKVGSRAVVCRLPLDRCGARVRTIVRVDDHDLKRCESHAITEWDKGETRTMKRVLVEVVKRVGLPTRHAGARIWAGALA
jgi:hypothetical protein